MWYALPLFAEVHPPSQGPLPLFHAASQCRWFGPFREQSTGGGQSPHKPLAMCTSAICRVALASLVKYPTNQATNGHHFPGKKVYVYVHGVCVQTLHLTSKRFHLHWTLNFEMVACRVWPTRKQFPGKRQQPKLRAQQRQQRSHRKSASGSTGLSELAHGDPDFVVQNFLSGLDGSMELWVVGHQAFERRVFRSRQGQWVLPVPSSGLNIAQQQQYAPHISRWSMLMK